MKSQIRRYTFMFQNFIILSVFTIGLITVSFNSDLTAIISNKNSDQELDVDILAEPNSFDDNGVNSDPILDIESNQENINQNSFYNSEEDDWHYINEEGEWKDYRDVIKPYKKDAQSINQEKTRFYNTVGSGLHVDYKIEYNKLLLTTTIGSYNTITYDFNDELSHAILIENTESSLNYGYPTVPYRNFVFNIPEYTTLKSVKVSNQYVERIYGLNLAPGPEPQYISDNNEVSDNMYFDPQAYSQITFSPAQNIEYRTVGIDGKSGIYLTVHPMQYNPAKRQIKFATQQTIEIEFENDVVLDDLIMNSVSSINSYEPNIGEGYVIIANQSFESSLTEFIAWKEQLGFNITIETIQDIYASYSGRDRPEQIRNFINASFNENGTKYILIVGDCDVVPVRQVVDPQNAGGLDNGSEPSDLYYECLDGDWDADGDNLFGETSDNVDFFPEVMVGRLPVNTPEQAHRVCGSIIRLESNPQSGDWMNNFLLIGPDCFLNGDGANMIEEELNQKYLYDSFFDVYRLYPTDGSLSHQATIDRINAGVGIIDFFDHGAYNQWVGSLTDTEAMALTNGNMSFLAFGMACETAAFDHEGLEPTISEAFFQNPNGGASVYIGATRIAWAGYHAFDGFHNQFWNYFLETALDQRICSPKEAFQSSLYETVTNFDMNNPISLETVYQAIYFGDPSMKLYWKHNVTTNSTSVNVNEEVEITTKCQLFLSDDAIISDVNVTVMDPIGRIIYEDFLTTDSQGEYTTNFYVNELPGVYTVHTLVNNPFEYTGITEFYVGDINISAQLDSDPIFNTLLGFSGTSDMDGIGNVSIVDNQGQILETKQITISGGIFSSDINITNFGPLFLYIQVENGEYHGATSILFKVVRGNVLVIADDTGGYGPNYPGGWADNNAGDSTNIADFKVALKEEFNVTFYYPRYEMAPSLSLLNSYDIVIVSVGDNIGSPLNAPNSFLLDVLLAYHNSGGHIIIEGGSILNTLNSGYNSYFPSLFHGTFDQHLVNSGNLYLDNGIHPITQGIPSNILIENGLGSNHADVFSPTNGSVHVSGYSGSFTGGTAISAYIPSNPLGGVIFLGFSIDGINNDSDRYQLIQNMIDFLLVPSFIVEMSDDALLLGSSETILLNVKDSATESPVNNANVTFIGCGIDISNQTLSDGTCTLLVNPSSTGLIQVEITKADYMDYTKTIVVYEKPIIDIDTNPSFLEGEESQVLTVITTDYYEKNLIENCLITIDGCGVTDSGYTNSSGEIEFTITPSDVGTIVITANKTDHINASSSIQVTNLKNYITTEIGYSWYDAFTNGDNLNVNGDDTYGVVNIPFQFYYYDTYFSTVYVSSNGWLSFSDSSPTVYSNPSFPSAAFPYAIAPLWDDLRASNNIYVWSTSDFVVIEYNNYYHLGGSLAGTFEVVLFNDGTIFFQYQSIQNEGSNTIGLNYGLNTSYYTIYANSLAGINDFTLAFTTGTFERHDINAELEIPSVIKYNDSYTETVNINVSVVNIGTYNEIDVELQLWIDDILVNTTVFPSVVNGTSETILYPWTPPVEGIYNITLYIEPINDESFIKNNREMKLVQVSSRSFILFDQGHSTDPIAFYSTWINNMTNVGYLIITTTEPITETLLEPYSVFIIPQAQLYYSPEELSAIQNYVQSGHGLFVIGDNYPTIYTQLTSFAGISWTYSGNSGITNDISSHPVTVGVNSVYFDAPECQLEVTDPALSLVRVNGISEFAVSDLGNGRVAGIGDEEIFLNGSIELEDNLILLMNLMEWLNTTEPLEHELSCSLEVSNLVLFGESTNISITVTNWGSSSEINVELQVWVNNSLKNSTVYPTLNAGASETLTYNWTPILESVYNITAYVVPKINEAYIVNNKVKKDVRVTSGSFILFDQGHSTDSIESYRPWVDELTNAGYFVFTTTNTITETLLAPYSALVCPQPRNSYSSAELSTIQSYVQSGHGLFVIGDNNYDIFTELTAFSGINWVGGGSSGTTTDITPHPVTTGVSSVYFSSPVSIIEVTDPAVSLVRVSGVTEFAVSDLGSGRVAGIGDENAITGTSIEQADNLLLMMNLMEWLCDAEPQDHELICSLDVPTVVSIEETVSIEMRVHNLGLNNETNVELQLWINNSLINKTVYPLLNTSNFEIHVYNWTPILEGVYNVTVYVVPVENETSLKNNRIMKEIIVSSDTFILVDQGHSNDPISFYSTWINNLTNAGYLVIPTTDPITETLLEPYSAFVIPQAHLYYSPEELSAIQSYVQSGHGLFVIGDDNPVIYSQLTSFAGINWAYSGNSGITNDISSHPVTVGVNSVYFDASECQLEVTDPAISIIRVNGITEFAVSDLGNGRVAGIGDEEMVSDISIELEDNLILLMNLMEWLNTTEPLEHELSCSLEVSNFVLFGESTNISITVTNWGLNSEINVELQVWVNNSLENSTVYPILNAGASETLTYNWTPILESEYNITAYVVPKINEAYKVNNRVMKDVRVTSGSFILVDQGHGTDSITSYSTLIDELTNIGNIVATTTEPLTEALLAPYSILILPQPQISYSITELNAIQSYVQSGHGLFVIGDDESAIYTTLTSFSGISWIYGGSSGTTTDITPHPVTDGVSSVYFSSPMSELEVTDPAISLVRVNGFTEFAVSDLGTGRVAGIGDENAIMGTSIGQADNLLLMMNLIDWLSDAEPQDHELICLLDSPSYVPIEETVFIEITVYNWGLNDETNVELQLWINNSLVNSTVYPLLNSSNFETLTFNWTPTIEGVYNVTAYVVPVENETSLMNNRVMKEVTVGPDIYILVDQGHGTDSITSYSTLVNELTNAGYFIVTTTEPLTEVLLAPYSILIIPQAQISYSSAELSAIQNYVQSGHGLFVIGDDESAIYTTLTSFSGISWIYGGNSGTTTNITLHPVTDGVSSVYFGSPMSELEVTDLAVSLVRVNGVTEFAVSDLGYGRVAGIGDEDGVRDSNIGQADNLLLMMNLIDWLSDAEPQDHELICLLNVPSVVLENNSIMINIKVFNCGLNNETNVRMTLWINSTQIESILYPNLIVRTFESLDYLWSPSESGMYNITVYVNPVINETNIQNNKKTIIITVDDTIDPTVNSPPDVSYRETETGNTIRWVVHDANPDRYIIYREIEIVQQDTWKSGDTIEINIDGLSEGEYSYWILVFDKNNNEIHDTVVVIVLARTKTKTRSTIDSGLIVVLPLAILFISVNHALKRKKRTRNSKK